MSADSTGWGQQTVTKQLMKGGGGYRRALVVTHGSNTSDFDGAKEKDAVSRAAVTSCAPALLVVVIKRLWRSKMNDESHVEFADSHTKADGCHYDLSAACEPVVLSCASLNVLHTSVIRQRSQTTLYKTTRHFFRFILAHAVNYPATAPEVIRYDGRNLI
jgi:hypothetical protein